MEYLGLIIGYLIIFITPVIGMWHKRMPDMGKKSSDAYIPFYNYFQLLKACKLPWYWVIFLLFPGAQFIMWACLNVTYIRKFGVFGIKETILGILFPFTVFYKIAKNPEQYKVAEPTNWDVARQVDARTPSDHVALFFALPVIGHIIAIPMSMLGFKRKPGKKSIFKEWGDAILFAIIAASVIRTYVFEPYKIPTGSMEKTLLVGDQLFVDKLTYGARLPMTPFSYPIVHNSFAPLLNVRSYIGVQKIPYIRLPGFRDVERNDVVVFNFPAGDTALNDPRMPDGLIGHTYSQILTTEAWLLCLKSGNDARFFNDNKNYFKNQAREQFINEGKVYGTVVERDRQAGQMYTEINGLLSRPIDKKENYIKRCVALPGDEIKIISKTLYVNNELAFLPDQAQFSSTETEKGFYNPDTLWKSGYLMYYPIFPNDPQYDWTEDNFGPLRIPKAGDVLELNSKTIPLYRRLIHAYEGHDLQEKADGIYIDGKKTETYTVQANYYWMMGDNRNGSADSRFWGFVPEDHIVGHAAFTWLSVDQQKGMFGGGMRWDRMFNGIK